MILSILKENAGENRVAVLPELIPMLQKLQIDVSIEHGAGEKASAYDRDYISDGAKVITRDEIFASSDIILKINPPTDKDVQSLRNNTVWISILQPMQNKDLIQNLNTKFITALGLCVIPRISRAQVMDILSSQASIAGYKAVIIAANYLPKFFPMMTTAAGTVPPAKTLILGAGVAGLQAIATARRLGSVVEAFDTRSAVKEEVQSLGAKFIEVEGAVDDASAGGYAVEQTEEFKRKQREMIQAHAAKSDVIITTAQIPGRKAPLLITKETVSVMKKGSVIVDLAASTGGNCELTENEKIINSDGVTIIGNSNLPSTLPSDSSKMFGKNVLNYLKLMIKEGKLNLDFNDEIINETCICHNGEIRFKKLLAVTENQTA